MLARSMDDICPLCNIRMDLHTVLTEPVKINGENGLRRVGWRCPSLPNGLEGVVVNGR